MEQRDIEILLTLAEELHFGRAAQRLRVSTSRVSQTIKKLERQIGTPLFERTSRRVQLTPTGDRLTEELRPAYRQILDAVAQARTAAGEIRAVLRVGFIGAAAGRFVLDVAEAIRTDHPGCDVRLRETQFGRGFGALRGGDVDMVLATVPARGAEQADIAAGPVLVEEEQMLAVPARHRLAGRPSVSFADLALTTVLRTPPTIPRNWDAAQVPAHAERGPAFDTTQEMLALVGAGIGTYPVSAQFTSHYVRPDVAYVPIHGVPPYQRRLFWLAIAETATIRTFDRTAVTVAARST